MSESTKIFEETIKKCQDLGIVFNKTDLDRTCESYRNPEVRINDDYYIESQMDPSTTYLYGLRVYYKDDNVNGVYINLKSHGNMEELKSFIDNFDKYEKVIDTKIKKLAFIQKLQARLKEIYEEQFRLELYEVENKWNKEIEYSELKNALNYIYSEKEQNIEE